MTQTMTQPEIPLVPERAIEEFEHRQHDLMRGFSECRELVDDAHFAQAGDALQAANDLLRQIDDAVDPTVRAADQVHKQAVAMRKNLRAPVETAVQRLKDLIGAYTRKREAAARAEQQRQQRLIEEAARARAETEAAERRRQEQARIERERIEAETPPTPDPARGTWAWVLENCPVDGFVRAKMWENDNWIHRCASDFWENRHGQMMQLATVETYPTIGWTILPEPPYNAFTLTFGEACEAMCKGNHVQRREHKKGDYFFYEDEYLSFQSYAGACFERIPLHSEFTNEKWRIVAREGNNAST